MKRGWLIGLTVIALVATGCGSKKATPPPSTTSTLPTTTTTPIGTPPPIKLTPVMKFAAPTAIAQRSDDDAMYVAERAGRIKVMRNGTVGATPVLDISSDVSTDVERGLLGLAFAPN